LNGQDRNIFLCGSNWGAVKIPLKGTLSPPDKCQSTSAGPAGSGRKFPPLIIVAVRWTFIPSGREVMEELSELVKECQWQVSVVLVDAIQCFFKVAESALK
jgi:hypothetical protein